MTKSVIPDGNTVQMASRHVHVSVGYAGVGVTQRATDATGIWQDNHSLPTQPMDIKVREIIWEIAQSIHTINKQGAGVKQWDCLINHCITRISDLESKWPLWKWFMSDKSNIDCQKLQAALDKFAEVDLPRRKNLLQETPTKTSNLVLFGIYFIIPMLHLPFLMMCRSRR
jgi:hypothetical protein